MQILLNILQDLYFLLIMLIGGSIFYKILCTLTSPKRYRYQRLSTLLCISALGSVLNVIIFNQDIFNITFAFIALCLIMLIFFDGSLLQRISAAIIFYPFIGSINYILEYLVWTFYPECGDISPYFYLMRNIKPIVPTLIWFIIYTVFQKKFVSVKQYCNRQTWILIDIISCAPLLMTGYIIVTTTASMQLYSMPAVLISLLTQFGILYLISYMAESTKIIMENENLRAGQQYYQELEHNQMEIRKLRHDMNNHFSTIETFLQQGDIESAKKYFASLSDIVRTTGRIFCNNSLANAVLNSKYQQAEALSIDTFFHIDIDSPLPLEDVDLCSLLANTLDNAIEACTKINEPSLRKIEVKARCLNDYFSYQVVNSCCETSVQKEGLYPSTKPDPEHHGLGLLRVTDIVQKYGGTIDVEPENEQFSVTCIIPLHT